MASSSARRRQRSTRLTVATALLAVAAVLVAWAFLDNVAWLQAAAAVAAVVLGVAATKITHSELMASRLDAARDRAEQARLYRELTQRRTAENAEFAAAMRDQIQRRETALRGLESALAQAREATRDAQHKFNREARRADDADDRAAEAMIRVAELEQELDVLRAEYDALHLSATFADLEQKHA